MKIFDIFLAKAVQTKHKTMYCTDFLSINLILSFQPTVMDDGASVDVTLPPPEQLLDPHGRRELVLVARFVPEQNDISSLGGGGGGSSDPSRLHIETTLIEFLSPERTKDWY